MYPNDTFMMDIAKIDLAHEFVLDAAHKCEYLTGRGMYGLVHGIGGTAEYRFHSGERLTVCEGDTLLLAPNTSYSIFTQTAFKHYTINFGIHKKSSTLDILEKPYCLLRNINPNQFNRLFEKLNRAWTQRNIGYRMNSISHLYALISLFYFEYKNQLTPCDSPIRLQPAKDMIERDFRSAITLEQLAKVCNMSVTNFRREWQKVYLITPIRYLAEIRLSYAKEYLISGYYSVSEIAARCGFENPSYFIRFFEKNVGITPGTFKKQTVIY